MTKGAEQYRVRMERVACHIEAALRDGHSPGLEELAAVAAFSPFHFHRLYRVLAGEPVRQTIQRLRLAGALGRVGDGASITEAAHEAGFDSSQSLARTAQKLTGASVSALKSSGRLDAEAGRLGARQDGDHAMAIELVEHAPITLACRLSVGPYPALNLSYRALFEDLLAIVPESAVRGIYGLPIDDPRDVPEAEHRFLCAIAVTGLPTPAGKHIEPRQVGGGAYARYRFVGPYADVPDAIDHIYADLVAQDRPLADEATFLHYVDQSASSNDPAGTHVSDIYVPLAAGWEN